MSATTRSARAERAAVERGQRARRERARLEAAAVGDERVCERDERVEDERLPARGAARGRQVEVARVADDHGVEVARAARRSSRSSGAHEPRAGPAPAATCARCALPDRHVPLDDLDAGAGAAHEITWALRG